MSETITLKRDLSLAHVVTMGLAWMSPMIFFTSFGVLHEGSGGMLLAAYVLAFAAILFTAASYGQMARAFPVSGSAYTYVSKAMNPFMGFIVGWVILLDYLFSCIVAVLMFGINLHAQFPTVPSYAWIILLTIVVMTINIIGIKTSANINKIFVMMQILFIASFCAFLAYKAVTEGFTAGLNPLSSTSGVSFSSILAGASLVCFSFLGFDSITTMAEETKDPKKTIPRAIMIIVIAAGIMYFVTAYLIQQLYPSLTFSHIDAAGFELMQMIGGGLLASIFTFVIIFSILAQGMASMTTVSRLLLVMGRSSLLPSKFSSIHPKFRTPVFNIVLVSTISLFAIFIRLETAIMFVSFGALTAFLFVNLSVIFHYIIRNKQREPKDLVFRLAFPLIGAGFVFYLITLLELSSLLLGTSWIVLGLILYTINRARSAKDGVVLGEIEKAV
ncbi:amino acid permease [Paenibacillus sp. TCA20]|uniref:Amino acid permease n=1 Tax=Paenibacillus urinalis TaxID=521520 RepID=A0AAX3MWI4_9BACL|nr:MULTISPECIES: amino acid permease [Paenibacillus]WDH80699.1 amino acid permease [Paenibacillus urinalis]GAK39063.1 amino acid permease [Paenibacillus sp. TCA20]